MNTSFYRAEHLAALKRKNRIWKIVDALIWLLTLGLCLYFILRRDTLNAARMEFRATVSLVLGGWLAIAVWDCALRYLRALREHEERILASEEEERVVRGSVTLDRKSVHISRSIDVRGVRVKTEEGSVRLLVNSAFAKALGEAAAQGELTLHAKEGYVTEVER